MNTQPALALRVEMSITEFDQRIREAKQVALNGVYALIQEEMERNPHLDGESMEVAQNQVLVADGRVLLNLDIITREPL